MLVAKVFSIALAFALAIGAQASPKEWAIAEEYDPEPQALAEPDPKQRITLLRDWGIRYPESNFERERLISFALALQQTGDPKESLHRANEALALNPNDPSILLLTAAVGPTLPAASDSEVATVAARAKKLLSINLSQKPKPVTQAQA